MPANERISFLVAQGNLKHQPMPPEPSKRE